MEKELNLTKIDWAIKTLPLSKVAKVMGMDNSTISHYRNGRSFKNVSITKLQALSDFPSDFSAKSTDEVLKYNLEKEVSEFKAKIGSFLEKGSTNIKLIPLKQSDFLNVKQVNKKLSENSYDKISLNTFYKLCKANEVMKNYVYIDNDKIFYNFLNLIKSTKLTYTELSEKLNKPANYISTILYKHSKGLSFIQNSNEKTLELLAKALTNNDVNLLKEKLLADIA